MLFRKLLLGLTIVSTLALGAPVPPSNGGTGVSNNAASTITINGAHALQLDLSAATRANLASDHKVYVDCLAGSNVTGNGSTLSKYASIAAAEVAITTASSSSPYVIEVSAGICTEAALMLKPDISINAAPGAQINVGALSLAASWGASSSRMAIVGGAYNITSANLDFNAVSSAGGIVFQNIVFDTSAADKNLIVVGNPNSPNLVTFDDVKHFGGNHLNFVASDVGSFIAQSLFDDVTVTSNSNTQNEFVLFNTSLDFDGIVTMTSLGSQQLVLIADSNVDFKGVVLNGANTVMLSDTSSFTSPLTLTGGAQYQLAGDSTGLPVSFVPTNYTPTSEPGNGGNPSLDANLRGIDAALGSIDSNVTLQDAYNNGTPGAQGSVNLTSDNLNPLATFNSYNGGPQEDVTVVNSATSSPTAWGYGFRAINSSSNYKDYAHIYANVENDISGSESGSLGLYAMSYGALTQAIGMSGQSQDINMFWPAHIPNGTQTYPSLTLLTGDMTYAGQFLGYTVVSDDVSTHDIGLPANYYSTNADDTYQIQTQSTYTVTITPSGGTTVNGSGSVATIPVNTLATLRLVNAAAKSWKLTEEGTATGNAVAVTDDNSTNATRYPLFAAANSGAQPAYVSSLGLQWNPNQQALTIGNDNFGDNISISGDMMRWEAGHDFDWDVGELSGPGFGPPDWSIYDYSNSTFVLIADTEGFLGPNPTTLYFEYPYNTFPNSTTANQLMATDANNLVTSVPNTLGKASVTDDNSTDAIMYPAWFNSNSGSLAPFVSSLSLSWNPGQQKLGLFDNSVGSGNLLFTAKNGQFITFDTQDSSVFAGEQYNDAFNSVPLFQVGIQGDGNQGYSIVDQVNNLYVWRTDPFGNLGPAGGLYSDYAHIKLTNVTSANRMVTTDGSNFLTSQALPASGAYTPAVSCVSNCTSPTLIKAFYQTSNTGTGSAQSFDAQVSFQATNTSVVLRVDCPAPNTVFGGALQASGVGEVNRTSGANPADGIVYDVDSQSGFAGAVVKMIVSVPAVNYTVNVQGLCQQQ